MRLSIYNYLYFYNIPYQYTYDTDDRMKLSAFKLYLLMMFMLLLAYVLSFEPTEYLEVELFDQLNNSTSTYNPDFPDLIPLNDGPNGTQPIIPNVPVEPVTEEQSEQIDGRGRGWKLHWNRNYNLSSVLPDTSFQGTNYTNYSKATPLKYDGVRDSINI